MTTVYVNIHYILTLGREFCFAEIYIYAFTILEIYTLTQVLEQNDICESAIYLFKCLLLVLYNVLYTIACILCTI